MSKEEKLMGVLGNIKESMGVFERTPAGAGASAPSPRPIDPKHVGAKRSTDVYTIEVDRIAPDPDQPRTEFDPEALQRLADSIRTKGQLQPIVVRWDEGRGAYVILMGERRWRAAQAAGVSTLRCVVRDGSMDDDERLSLQLVENCLREDLSPIEQARAFRTLMERQGWTQEKLADELAVSRMLVSRAIGLLRLPESIQDQVDGGALAASSAYEIAKLDDPAEQIRLAETAVEQKLTRDDVVKQVKAAPRRKASRRVQTTVVYRLGGYKITLERKAGVEWASAAAAIREALARIDEAAGQSGTGSQAEAA